MQCDLCQVFALCEHSVRNRGKLRGNGKARDAIVSAECVFPNRRNRRGKRKVTPCDRNATVESICSDGLQSVRQFKDYQIRAVVEGSVSDLGQIPDGGYAAHGAVHKGVFADFAHTRQVNIVDAALIRERIVTDLADRTGHCKAAGNFSCGHQNQLGHVSGVKNAV